MLFAMPTSTPWKQHLADRTTDAIEIKLIKDSSVIPAEKAQVFLPENVNKSTVLPDHSLLIASDKPLPIGRGWVRREDLFPVAAKWLFEEYKDIDGEWLICETGLSSLGDECLKDIPHIEHENRPLQFARFSDSSPEIILSTLRHGRSYYRFLGVVVSHKNLPHSFSPVDDGLFICDALDCDSLIVVPFIVP